MPVGYLQGGSLLSLSCRAQSFQENSLNLAHGLEAVCSVVRLVPEENVKRFRGGPVFKAHRLLHHSTLGVRVIEKKKRVLRNLELSDSKVYEP